MFRKSLQNCVHDAREIRPRPQVIRIVDVEQFVRVRDANAMASPIKALAHGTP